MMGDGVLELIQVSEMHPPVDRAPHATRSPAMPLGVVPYLTIDGASEACTFYQQAFGAREIARMPGADGKRLMHGSVGRQIRPAHRSVRRHVGDELPRDEVARAAIGTRQEGAAPLQS